MNNETTKKRYYVYEMETKKNICYTDDFNHAYDLKKSFEEASSQRHSIKVEYIN